MPDHVISNTSCLILLDNINKLDLLQHTYETIIATEEVIQEFGKNVPNWVEVRSVQKVDRQRELGQLVDKGEASVIALALELNNPILIIDDKRGRKLAQGLNIELTGTLGVLLLAKKSGIIPQVRPLLDKLKSIDYRISPKIAEGILKRAGE